MLRENVTDRGGNNLHAEMWVARFHVCIVYTNIKLTCHNVFQKYVYKYPIK